MIANRLIAKVCKKGHRSANGDRLSRLAEADLGRAAAGGHLGINSSVSVRRWIALPKIACGRFPERNFHPCRSPPQRQLTTLADSGFSDTDRTRDRVLVRFDLRSRLSLGRSMILWLRGQDLNLRPSADEPRMDR